MERDLLPDLDILAAVQSDVAWAVERIKEYRAILAPLLDDFADPCDGEYCVFCRVSLGSQRVSTAAEYEHRPGCPVPRKDELLGRQDP